jgi:oxygen-independent coproporphyrinogen-3 oxidase
VEERLSPRDRLNERIMLGLRTREGLDIADLRAAAGDEAAERVAASLRGLAASGLVVDEGERLRLTPAGLCVANHVIARLFR